MTYMTERKKVHKEVSILDDLEYKTLAQAANVLEELSKQYPPDAKICIGTEERYGSDVAYVNIEYEDWESVSAFNARKQSDALREEAQRKQYEALKKKFGV